MPTPQEVFRKTIHNKFTLCGTGILPVADNDARCEMNAIYLAP
ncbi:hypothetical protein QUB61_33910 [Microcoleus sp. C2D2]